MKTYFDCIPCFIRQALDAARWVTDDETLQEMILRHVFAHAAEMDLTASPPVMGRTIHRLVRKISGNPDPYAAVKHASNRLALSLVSRMQARIEASTDPFETAVRLAMAGNIIDFGVYARVDHHRVCEALEASFHASIAGDVEMFRQDVIHAERILYLTDNAGEIVFDRLLISRIGPEKITVAVKGFPVINDATIADADDAGLTGMVRVIDNGADVPGTVLEACSADFRETFRASDLIIAKGQGNYETLSEVSAPIVFLLKAKCPVIARDLGVEIGSLVLHRVSQNSAVSPLSHASDQT
ncbi:MAG TPA: ARMT1-like domain-containing protein [bacterium]|nr:ARMT1-like domain-containing protein [bacterium]